MDSEFSNLWLGHIATLAKLCGGWPGFESYTERLENMKGFILTKLKEIYQVKPTNLFNVLNHGDMHSKNMMFKIEEGVTTDILLVFTEIVIRFSLLPTNRQFFQLDYQISFWGSPACDIIYSLYNTCSVETRDNHRDELIKFYHDELTATLNKFGYLKKMPTLLDLHVEIVKCGHLGKILYR